MPATISAAIATITAPAITSAPRPRSAPRARASAITTGTAIPIASAAAILWVSTAATSPTSASAMRPRFEPSRRSQARSTNHTAVSATPSPMPFLTNSIDRYIEPALVVARVAASSPPTAPWSPPASSPVRARRAPTPYAGIAIAAPSTAAPSLAPTIGSVTAANGASSQNPSGEAGYCRWPCASSERSWTG